MSATGLDVFDKTVQTTNVWLNEISDELGPDRNLAWHVLGTVLRTVRDRVPHELGAHLGAELPLIVRGAYYDGYRPSQQPERTRSPDEFLEHIADGLQGLRPINPEAATKAVLGTVSRHLPEGQIAKLREALPDSIRPLWPDGNAKAH
jgi:uncharacterized protein (DUF2267 family)